MYEFIPLLRAMQVLAGWGRRGRTCVKLPVPPPRSTICASCSVQVDRAIVQACLCCHASRAEGEKQARVARGAATKPCQAMPGRALPCSSHSPRLAGQSGAAGGPAPSHGTPTSCRRRLQGAGEEAGSRMVVWCRAAKGNQGCGRCQSWTRGVASGSLHGPPAATPQVGHQRRCALRQPCQPTSLVVLRHLVIVLPLQSAISCCRRLVPAAGGGGRAAGLCRLYGAAIGGCCCLRRHDASIRGTLGAGNPLQRQSPGRAG